MAIESSTIQSLDEFISSKCSEWKAPGVALMMSCDGEPNYRYMHGFSDVERMLPVTQNTVFGVASVTKSMTALAVMQAQDRGMLSVHDVVVRWLPELRVVRSKYVEQVTIHHLLTHTAGFPGMSALFRARAASIRNDADWVIAKGDMPNPFTVDLIQDVYELIPVMGELNFDFLDAPGTVFNYSNEGYALLQGILERATGKGFLEFVQESILGPLDMNTAVFRTEDLSQLPEVTELYAVKVDGKERMVFHSPAWWDVGNIYTNGSLKASPVDLLRYLEVYRNHGVVGGHRIVSEASLEQMTTPYVKLPTGYSYGYGLHVDNHHGLKVVSHGGGIKGVSANILVCPEEGVTAVALCNLAGVPVAQLTTAALNVSLGLPLTARTIEYPVSGAGHSESDQSERLLDQYVGHYRSDEGGSADVQLENGKLSVTMAGQHACFRSFQKDGFVDASGTWAIGFMRDNSEKVNRLFSGVRVLSKMQ